MPKYLFSTLLLLSGHLLLTVGCEKKADHRIHTSELQTLRRVDTSRTEYLNLKNDEAFWENRLQISEDKIIDLVVDLREKRIILENRGVPLRQVNFRRHKKDLQLFGQPLLNWAAKPFVLLHEVASIPKQPIQVRRLPEETSKLEKGYDFNFVDSVNTVFVRLIFNREFEIELLETGKSIPDSLLSFDYSGNWMQFALNRSDIIAIYRALPARSQMILRLENVLP